MSIHIAYIGVGSNIGDRRRECELAVYLLEQHPAIHILKKSTWIETKPVGNTEQPYFLNGVLKIETSLGPEALLHSLLSIEQKMGRTRKEKWGPRIIDLDILLYDHITYTTSDLSLPHPEMKHRDFIKRSLLEIEPGLKHLFYETSHC
jgi:2-amino-4-hydroxy-6-hydroxymethyldihydropteridine diphosphokinase